MAFSEYMIFTLYKSDSLYIFLQKFSASQRQLGTAEGGMAHSADVMSDDAKASSKFQWFRLAGLEKLSSIQSMQLDENLDKLDSASVLQVQLAAAAAGNGPSLYYVSIFLDLS